MHFRKMLLGRLCHLLWNNFCSHDLFGAPKAFGNKCWTVVLNVQREWRMQVQDELCLQKPAYYKVHKAVSSFFLLIFYPRTFHSAFGCSLLAHCNSSGNELLSVLDLKL